MKVLNILCLAAIVISVGCKTQKIAPKPEPVSATSSVKTTEKGTESKVSSAFVNSKAESVTAAKGEDSDFGNKRFYVIVGSFGVYENAQKFKKQLMSEDFFPGILVNEAGLFRVSVNSYDEESLARTRISDIRTKFPKYSDVWLLVKK